MQSVQLVSSISEMQWLNPLPILQVGVFLLDDLRWKNLTFFVQAFNILWVPHREFPICIDGLRDCADLNQESCVAIDYNHDWNNEEKYKSDDLILNWSVMIALESYKSNFNSHVTKKFTPHITSWSCRTKGIDFANLSRDRVTHEYLMDCL